MLARDAFLRTRVARRILGLFLLCAMIPTLTLGFLAYRHVGGQLERQSRARLSQLSKASGMAVIERLQLAETELEGIAGTAVGSLVQGRALVDVSTPTGLSHFDGAAVFTGDDVVHMVHGEFTVTPPPLSGADSAHLASGKSLVKWVPERVRSTVLLALAIDSRDAGKGVIWGQVSHPFLWRTDVTDPLVDLCVFAADATPIYCSRPRTIRSLSAALPVNAPAVGHFSWEDAHGAAFLAGTWSTFLTPRFGSPSWTIVVSESTATALAPMAGFKRTFPLVLLLTFWAVFLLSNIQIRRSLNPLVELREGTKRIAAHDFTTDVQVTSKDEFADLAVSFNTMGRRLGKQFAALTAISEIDRAILSTLDADQIIDTVLSRFSDIMPCDGLSISIAPRGVDREWKYVAVAALERLHITRDIDLSAAEIQELLSSPDHVVLGRHMGPRSYLNDAPEVATRRTCALVLPLRNKGVLTGIIVLDYFGAPTFGADDLLQARRLADQVAVALSNTRLVRDLDDLSWGALRALARTIDANSNWTAGHSERVTSLALALGEQMGLPATDLATLHRGGLLHDIGKIGIPQQIIDKAGPLTLEEVNLVREHPTIGAEILSPITAFKDALPVVLYHHEWFDGSGYPDGLAGADIPFLARILTVADVYDALTSDRPYRAGWTTQQALGYISQKASIHFDPEVAAAFLDGMKARGFAPTVRGAVEGSLDRISSRGREKGERGNWRTGTE